jgi:protein TonB
VAEVRRGLGFRPEVRTWRGRVRVFVVAALLIHALLGFVAIEVVPKMPRPPRRTPMRFVMVEVPEKAKEEAPPEEELSEDPPIPELDGQIVELPPPDEEKRPEHADYLAEYDITVDKETRTRQFEVNPEILAPKWSEDQKMKQAEAQDLGMDKPSTGAQVGNNRKPLGERGSIPALPSPWAMTNKEGFQDPTVGAGSTSDLAGAPQNDLLDEEVGDRVALNAKENLFVGYLNRIRRLVNFYWDQNLHNLPSGMALAKTSYATTVEVVLDGAGALEVIKVIRESGSPELDDCLVRAFRSAGPFPNPPEGLIEKDGRVYLPHMTFQVGLGQAKMNYGGVDPRAGVQFPGIMKSPY